MADVNNERNIRDADRKKREQGLGQGVAAAENAAPTPPVAQAPVNPAAAEAAKNPSLRNFREAKDEAQAARLEAEPPKTFMGIRFDSSLPGADTRQASKNIEAAKPPKEPGPPKGLRPDPVHAAAAEPVDGPGVDPGVSAEVGGVNPKTTALGANPTPGASSPTDEGARNQGLGANSMGGSLDYLVNPDQVRFVNNDAILASADKETGKYNSFTRAMISPDGEFMGGGPGIAGQGGALSDEYMDRMNRASIASADYMNRMNRAREIYADMREMRRGSGQGSGVNVIRDEARERRNALMALDDRGDGLRPAGAYKNLLAFKAASQLLDGQGGQGGQGGQAAQAGAGGLRGAGATDPMQHVKSSIEAQKALVELKNARRGTPVDPNAEYETQLGHLSKETELSEAQLKQYKEIGNAMLRTIGQNPEDETTAARLDAAVGDLMSGGPIEIGKEADGTPIMQDFGKLTREQQANAIRDRVLDREALDAYAAELEELGVDPSIVLTPGFLDQMKFSEESPSSDIKPWNNTYNFFTNPRLWTDWFGGTGSSTVMDRNGNAVQVRLDKILESLSSPAAQRHNERYGRGLRSSKDS